MRQIRCVRRSVSRPLLITLVNVLVIPQIDYCNASFTAVTKSQICRLQSDYDHSSSPFPRLAAGQDKDRLSPCRSRFLLPTRVDSGIPLKRTHFSIFLDQSSQALLLQVIFLVAIRRAAIYPLNYGWFFLFLTAFIGLFSDSIMIRDANFKVP